MPNKSLPTLAVCGLLMALPGVAQPVEEPPLPWLSESLRAPATPRPRPSPSDASREVAVDVLGRTDRDATGLIPAKTAGLPSDMWQGGNSDRAIEMLGRLPPSPLPGAEDLVQRLVLSEANPPDRDDDALLVARIDALLRRGALDRAQALIERAGPATPDLFRRWFDIGLLTDSEDRACAALEANPGLTPSQMTRVFCLARDGRWTAAALTLETAHALGDLSGADYDLLARFLDPELFEGEPSLPRPSRVTPLSFRLFEAIGEPLATRDLPLAFAWSDLRFVTGWKAQLEAAERLARSGAMSGNRLLGLYTERRATVSGAIWDRARSVQALDLALNASNRPAVETHLSEAVAVMAPAALEPALAQMFAPRLGRILEMTAGTEAAARLSIFIGGRPAALPETASDKLRLAHGLVTRSTTRTKAPADIEPLLAAFDKPEPQIRTGVGETILAALTLLAPGAEADLQDRSDALRLLRAAGQEHSARRIAAELILLEDALR